MANRHKAPIIDLLRQALIATDVSDVSRPTGTKNISQIIHKVCTASRFRCIAEYPAGEIKQRNSYIDFVCTQRQGANQTYNIAIEVDSSNKHLSLEKLMEMNSRGFQCVWIRWFSENLIDIPEEIEVINLYGINQRLLK